jgi:sugar-specific transcriptional regulator TrmB
MLHETSVEKALQSFGLTNKEAQIYIFLAKHGLQKGIQIAAKTRTAKAVVYRILKILQKKGFVEATLESPIRFKAIPFKNILDSEIKARHEEAFEIENSKDALLSDWDKISKAEPPLQIEKFVTIEGTQRIYHKIYEMVKTAKHELSIISTVRGIMRSDHFGITNEIINHPLRKNIKVRFLTDLAEADMRAIQFLKKKLKTSVDLRGRNTALGLKPFPRMVIRDKKEILFFITPKTPSVNPELDETCLCTNCKSLINAFSGVFEDLWHHSIDIEQKIIEVQTGKRSPKTIIIENTEIAKRQYIDALKQASNEVLFVTSTAGLTDLRKQTAILQDWAKRELSIKIMAPITNENLKTARELLQWCEIKHVPTGYFETTIIDEKSLFQFHNPAITNEFSNETKFKNTFYTNDTNHVKKTKKFLEDIWLKTRMPSSERDESFSNALDTCPESTVNHHTLLEETSFMRLRGKKPKEETCMADVLSKIEKEKENSQLEAPTWSDTLRYFGSIAAAIVELPKNFGIPKMFISFAKHDKQSSFGEENYIIISLKQENCEDPSFIPFAMVIDRPEPLDIRKTLMKGFPAENNILLFEKDEIQFQVKGNTFFAGWTKPIPVAAKGFTIPSSCMLFEGYGDAKSGCFYNQLLSGRRQEVWYNSFNAFVSYFHPKLRYEGAGTEGYIEKDWLLISEPPKL